MSILGLKVYYVIIIIEISHRKQYVFQQITCRILDQFRTSTRIAELREKIGKFIIRFTMEIIIRISSRRKYGDSIIRLLLRSKGKR